jgi:hypothetical protein
MQQLTIIQCPAKAYIFADDAAWSAQFGEQYLFTCDAGDTKNVHILTDTPELTSVEIDAFLRDKKLLASTKILNGETLAPDFLASEGWRLRGNLARIVYALRCIYEEGMDGNFVTFSHVSEGNYFVQFAGSCGEAELFGDASSNHYVDAGYELDDEQIGLMEAHDWETPGPDDFSGFNRQFQAASDMERFQIALEIQYIFEKVYRVDFSPALYINLCLQ